MTIFDDGREFQRALDNKEINDLKAENERLNSELDKCADEMEIIIKNCGHWQLKHEELRKAIEDTLERIKSFEPTDFQDIIWTCEIEPMEDFLKKALGGKKP